VGLECGLRLVTEPLRQEVATEMSENYRFYRDRMRTRRDGTGRPLHSQLLDLLAVVARCEAMWALEDRIERSR
jgi:hypothetical protein